MNDDPIKQLNAALAKIKEAQARAAAEGVTIPAEELEAFVRAETGGQFGYQDAVKPPVRPKDVLASAVQGLTFGFADDVLAANRSPEAAAALRASSDRLRAERPGVNAAAEIAGSLPWMAIPALVPALRGGRGVVAGAAAGGVAGGTAAAGFSDAETLGGRLDDAAGGVGVGVLAGAALPAAANAARFLSPVERARMRMQGALDRSGGADAVRRTADRARAAGKNDHMRLADASLPLRTEADFAANNAQDVFESISDVVAARQAGQSGRMLEDVRYAVGSPVSEQRLARMTADKRAWADSPAGFEGLRQQNPIVGIDPEMATRLQQPRIRAAFDRAREAGNITPETQPYAFAQAVAEGRLPRPISFADLQAFKEHLDDATSAAFQGGRGNLGRSLATVRDEVTEILTAKVPGYRAVVEEYAERSARERALRDGVAAWRIDDTRMLTDQMSTLTAPQRVEYRLGMASELLEQLRSVATNRDQAMALINRGPALDDKLRIVFGDKRTFEEFLGKAALEADFAKLRGVVGGSATHRRGAYTGFDPVDAGASMVAGAPPINAMRSAGSAMIPKAMTRRTAQEEGRMLMARGYDEIDKVLTQLEARNILSGRMPLALSPILGARAGLLGAGSEP